MRNLIEYQEGASDQRPGLGLRRRAVFADLLSKNDQAAAGAAVALGAARTLRLRDEDYEFSLNLLQAHAQPD